MDTMPTDHTAMRTAPPLLRALSWALDAAVIGVAMVVVPEPYPPVLPIVLAMAYLTVLLWWTSTTIGKAALGLRVIRTDGTMTFAWAFARSTVGLLIVDLLGAGLLPALVSDDRRALHDRAFHSVVTWTGEPATWRRVADRVAALAEHRQAAGERTRAVLLLTGLWAWLSGLAQGVRRHMARLWGEAPGPSTTVAHALATKVAVGVVVVATGTGAAIAAAVPGAGDIGAVLFTPRCYVTDGCDPPGDADELLAIQRWIQTYEDDPSITLEHCGDAISDEERWCARIYTDSAATADLVGTGSGHAATLHGPYAEYVDALDKDGTAANPPCRIVQISEDGSGGHHVESPSWCPWDW